MELFRCPVCQNGMITGESGDKKVSCSNCGTLFQYNKDYDSYILAKLVKSEYEDQFQKLSKRQNEMIGFTSKEWKTISDGGLLKDEEDTAKAIKKREDFEKLSQDMITVTTYSIEGRSILEYKGIVSGQVVAGIDFIKDFFSQIRNKWGGRSITLQNTIKEMREEALNELKMEAFEKGANAVVAIKLDFDEYSEGMLMLTVSGTAVVLE